MHNPVRDSSSPHRAVTVALDVRCVDEFAADARLLRAGAPAVRVATVGETAVSFGVGERDDAGYLHRAGTAGIPTVRRSTGGTGVFHAPGDLTWSVVVPREDPKVGRDFVRAYARLGDGVVRFLRSHHVSAEWTAPPNLSAGYCVLSGRGEVLAVGPRALGGAAQHLSRTALLHQGMIPLEVDRGRIAELFDLPAAMLSERLTGLRELGVRDPPAALAQELARELDRRG